MRIHSVSQQKYFYDKVGIYPNKKLLSQNSVDQLNKTSRNRCNVNAHRTPLLFVTSFNGHRLHILDGGVHAKNMKFFAKSLNSDFKINMHAVELNKNDKYKYTKQLKSLLEQLQVLNQRDDINSDDIIAIPCLATVPLLNIQDQYNVIMQENRTFTPENIKANKKIILNFLEKLYKSPTLYRKYIDYMDPIHCGIEFVYPVIEEINKLMKKTYNIYVPSGHPIDLTLKWMAEYKNLKPELNHYIATGEDINGVVKKICNEIKGKNWYSFNLLSLSDAHIVGLKHKDWTTDFIFSAYDSCITKSARGVYNFTPIREYNKIIGYSFYNDKDNNYPYEEFSNNKQIENLLKFVGKNVFDVIATEEETKNFLKEDSNVRNLEPHNRKLYRVELVFSKKEIEDKKIKLLGKYVDSSLKVFYDKNLEDQIIFKKFDYEGSGRPSVYAMWGSCFALFNAIANDVSFNDNSFRISENYDSALNYALNFKKNKDYTTEKYEKLLLKAADLEKVHRPGNAKQNRVIVYEELSKLYFEKKEFKKSAECLNMALHILANQYCYHSICKDISVTKKYYDIYNSSLISTNIYKNNLSDYWDTPSIFRFLMHKPERPNDYELYKKYEKHKDEYNFYNKRFVLYYNKLSNICSKLGEDYPAKICQYAANDIENCSKRGMEIILRRKDGIIYIGDLYENQ